MSEKKFDIYFEFNNTNLNLAGFNKINNKLEYYKEHSYLSHFDNYKELNFAKLDTLVESSIFDIEKLTKEFVRDIYLIVETVESISIQMSVRKNNEGNKISKDDAMYLVQDAKQELFRSNQDLSIIHMIVENYVLDDSNNCNCNIFVFNKTFLHFN